MNPSFKVFERALRHAWIYLLQKAAFYGESLKVKIAAIVMACLMLLAFGFYVFLHTIDTEPFQRDLQQRATDVSNGTLKLGEVSWSIIPRVTLHIGPSTLYNNENQKVFTFKSAEFRLAFGALFQNEIQVKNIHLDTPHAYYESDGNGHHSWEGLFQKFSLYNRPAEPEALNHLLLDRLSFSNGSIHISRPKIKAFIENIELNLDNIELDSVARLKSSAFLRMEIQHTDPAPEQHSLKEAFLTHAARNIETIQTPLHLTAKLRFFEDRVQFFETQLESDIEGLYKSSIEIDVQSQGQYTFGIGELLIDPIEIRAEEARLRFKLKAETTEDQASEIIISVPQQTPRIGKLFQYWVKRTPTNEHIIDLVHSIELGGLLIINENSIGISLKPFNVDAHPGQIELAYNQQTKHITSSAILSYIDLRPVLDPPEPRIISATAVKTAIEDIPELQENTALAESLVKDTPARILLDFGNMPLPGEPLKNLSLEMKMAVDTLIHPDFEITAFKAHARADNGIITLNPATFSAFNGSVDFKMRLDANQTPLTMTFLQSSERIDAGLFLERTTQHKWLLGRFDNKFQIKSSGATFNDLLQNAEGSLDLRMQEGYIPGVNLHKTAYDSMPFLKGILTPSQRKSFDRNPLLTLEGTKIDDFFGSFQILPEVVSVENALVRLNGESSQTSISFARASDTVEFMAPLHLNTHDDLLRMLVWPVTCKIKDWDLPRCGVRAQKLKSNAQEIMDLR